MEKNDYITLYFKKYPRNLYFLLCSSYPLNKNQIFRILGEVKENEKVFKDIKRILRENKNIKLLIEEFKSKKIFIQIGRTVSICKITGFR